MPKCFSIHRLLHIRITSIVAIVLGLIAIIQLFICYGQYKYDHLLREDLEGQIYTKVHPDLAKQNSKPDCKYDTILLKSKSVSIKDIPKKFNDFSVKGVVNGSYVPVDCKPLISVAILVTYRNRQSQLEVFMPYMHNFLRKQNIHYKIYLVEQQDDKQWNKGMLYNIGAKYAIAENFPCLILHDIDLLPLDEGNLYACLEQPRHMSASIDKFRFVLTYDTLVGGVLAIRADQFKEVNGFSNRFKGWGGEDDDFAARMAAHNLDILRFPPELSRYTMLVHEQEVKNEDRHRILAESGKRMAKDGLSSAHHAAVSVKPNVLFTLLGVKL